MFLLLLLLFWLCPTACGILIPLQGIDPQPPALEAWRLSLQTTREVLEIIFLKRTLIVSKNNSELKDGLRGVFMGEK